MRARDLHFFYSQKSLSIQLEIFHLLNFPSRVADTRTYFAKNLIRMLGMSFCLYFCVSLSANCYCYRFNANAI